MSFPLSFLVLVCNCATKHLCFTASSRPALRHKPRGRSGTWAFLPRHTRKHSAADTKIIAKSENVARLAATAKALEKALVPFVVRPGAPFVASDRSVRSDALCY